MVSVIVPVYKVEEYLSRCVNSILAQSYKDLEIILVDDGSPDNCGKICDEFAEKDNRIKVIHKENGGLSSARNAGLDVAKGTYVCFIDSDDWVEKDFVECLRSIMIDTDSDMSACTFCRTKGDIAKRQNYGIDIKIITDKKCACIFSEKSYAGYACNKMYKREIIENNKIRFDESIFNGEDFPFTLEYVKHVNKVAFTKQDLYFYFFRETSIMHTIRLNERFITILYAREKALAILEELKDNSYDVCKASYLNILSKIKFMAMQNREKFASIYDLVQEKIKQNKKGIFKLKGVGFKNKFTLFLMIYFPTIASKLYCRKIKVD